MSVFKLRDWWSTTCGTHEEFDKRALVVTTLDGADDKEHKIVVGSFAGILRVYGPKNKGFQADDLLLEHQMDGPILQIEAGAFLANSTQTAIAVLHPRKLVVLSIQRQGAVDSDNPLSGHYAATRQYEHNLERQAYNFCQGAFGYTHGKAFVAVQSLDGVLRFFEQDKVVCDAFIPDALVPGHLCYNPKGDTFITNSSEFEILCFSYKALTSSSATKEDSHDGDASGASGKKAQAEWKVNIGEEVMDIRVARCSRTLNAPHDIVVLGERTLFLIKTGGAIRLQKRMDYFNMCQCPFPLKASDPNTTHNLLIGTAKKSIQVLDDAKVVWAATTQYPPLAMGVGSFGKVEGMIVVLGPQGQLSVNYLGTDPASTTVQILESKELDYEEMDEEHRRLQAMIRQAVNAGKAEPREQVQISLNIPRTLDSNNGIIGTGNPRQGRCATVTVTLNYPGEADIENAVMTVSVPAPFQLEQQSIVIPLLRGLGGGGHTVTLPFVLPEAHPNHAHILLPTSLSTTVIVAYTAPSGEPLTSKATFMLPLALAGSVIERSQNANFKITLDINKNPPPLTQLFDDILGGRSDKANAVSFQYANTSMDATILVSKNAGRYRIQSNGFESLWLITSELVRRLKAHFAENAGQPLREGEDQGPFSISYTENLPFQEYFQTIDAHFKARMKVAESHQVLSERAHQFRAIQKRLLVRFKDRNPSPLQNLDLLFEETYNILIKIADQVEGEQAALQSTANALACATNLMLILIRYRLSLKKDEFGILRYHLSPVVIDSQAQGWEECTDAAMTHLLRTCLAKNVKESSSMPQPLQVPTDIGKLKKHIALVCDRLSKGGSLRVEQSSRRK